MAKAACTQLSPDAINAIRGLTASDQATVLRATLRELRQTDSPEDETDCVSVVDGAPWRWHLAGKHVIEYRSLTIADRSPRCRKGGFLIQNVIRATPAILAYLQLKG